MCETIPLLTLYSFGLLVHISAILTAYFSCYSRGNVWCYSHPHNPLTHRGATFPSRPGTPHYRGFSITLRHTTVGRTPLHEGSARRRDLYLTTHNTHNRQTAMSPGGIRTHNPRKRAVVDFAVTYFALATSLIHMATCNVDCRMEQYRLLVEAEF